MKSQDPHAQTVEEVNQRLRTMWISWGLIPLGIAFVLMVIMSLIKPASGTTQPEQLALGFKGVMAAGGALFLLGFWLDGRWTEAGRLARTIYTAAGGNGFRPSRRQLAEHAHLAMESLLLSTKALTVIGLLIGLAAVLAATAGLKLSFSLQILLLAVAFQLFIFSRHPYYRELMATALQGELVVEEDEKDKD